MNGAQLSKPRFIVGIMLIILAALIFLFFNDGSATAGAIGIGILGLVSIAISRRR